MKKTAKINAFSEEGFFWLIVGIMMTTLISCIIIMLTNDESGYFLWVRLRPLVISNHFVSIFILLTPYYFLWRTKHKAPPGLLAMWAIFMFGSNYLGSALDVYFIIPHLDTLMHAYSGGLLVILGFMLFRVIHKDNEYPQGSSPVFIIGAAFCFAMTVGVVWEIYEYLMDIIMGWNMQRFARQYLDGTRVDLIGQEALHDTMTDFIGNMAGAIVVLVAGYKSLKIDGKFAEWMKFNKIESKIEAEESEELKALV